MIETCCGNDGDGGVSERRAGRMEGGKEGKFIVGRVCKFYSFVY
jgi:hypothetical protein